MLSRIKPYGFTQFIQKYGEDELLDRLEQNENLGVIYHREGIIDDYYDFEDAEQLIGLIKTGTK